MKKLYVGTLAVGLALVALALASSPPDVRATSLEDALLPAWFLSDRPEVGDVVLEEEDDGRHVKLEEAQTLVISLRANPSTGYVWQVQAVDEEKILQVGETEFRADSQSLGVPGHQIFRFRMLRADDVTLPLVYRRPWEDAEPLRTFSVHVEGVGTFTESAGRIPEVTMTVTPAPSPVEVDLTSDVETTQSLPSSFNWCNQGGCTPVKDQGSCGSCWAFATAGTFESAIKIADGVTRDLSEQYLLSCNTDGYSCAGGWWAFNYYLYKVPPGEQEAGAVYESEFPYVGYQASCTTPHEHYEKLDTWSQAGTSVATIKQAIYDHGPVAVSMCSGTYFAYYSGGVFSTDESASCGGGTNHAVILVGWDDSLGTSGAWRLKNSWGGWWGESGYMWIEYGTSNVGANVAYVEYGDSVNPNDPPYAPSNPSPAYGATGQSVAVDLSWSGGDPDSGDTVTYDVYLEANDSTPDNLVCSDATSSYCDPGTLSHDTYYWWYVVATDNHDASTSGNRWYFKTEAGSSIGPLVYDSHAVDDDSSGYSAGDGDGAINPGETIELSVDLYNQGTDTASGVAAVLSTGDAYASIGDAEESYPDIPGGGTRACYNDFVFTVDPSAPAGHVIQFDLDVTATSGGPWSDAFEITVQSADDAIVSVVPASSSVYKGDTFDVTVGVQGAQDLGSYEFTMGFDPTVLQVVDVVDGGFLGSTGRSVTSLGPTVNSGSVTFGAVSSGTADGPQGDGSLAVLTLEAIGLGTTSLDLHDLSLQDTSGVAQNAVAEDGAVDVTSNPCTTVSIDTLASDSPVTLGETMHFAALSSGSTPITYYWDFNNDGYKEQTGEGLDQVSHTYTAAGSYIVRLSVENACGSDWKSILVEVEPGSCVAVSVDSLTSDSPVALGEDMHFTATVSGSEPMAYSWGFGGTGTGTDLDTATPVFTYDVQGTYTVSLYVENSCGTHQATLADACVLFGDFDGDGSVTVADIMAVAARWRMSDADPGWEPQYDLDGDGTITVVDVMMVAEHWGESCP